METCYKSDIEPRVFQILSQRVAGTEAEDVIDLELRSDTEEGDMGNERMDEPEFDHQSRQTMGEDDRYYLQPVCRSSVFLLQDTGELSECHQSQYRDLDPNAQGWRA